MINVLIVNSVIIYLLLDGYRFHSSNQTITVMEEVNGNKVISTGL